MLFHITRRGDTVSFTSVDIRHSDSPLIEVIWHGHRDSSGHYLSYASSEWWLLFVKKAGKTQGYLYGPETQATCCSACTADAEILGIAFKLGTFMPHLPPAHVVNDDLMLPRASDQAFWLKGSAWQFPRFDDAETFAQWLEQDGLLVRDPVVSAALQGETLDVSPRCLQYRFRSVTGLSQRTILQIERARRARELLAQGVSVFDTVYETGYADQSHLTRSLKHFMGQTPTQLMPKISVH
jgi:AraC-like DNA-binding protein